MKGIIFVFAVVFLISGCATYAENYRKETQRNQKQETEIVDTFTVQAPYGRTWKALVTTFAKKQYPIKMMDKESGVLTTEEILFEDNFPSFFADKEIQRISVRPSIFMAVWKAGKYQISVFLTEKGNQTELTLKCTIGAFNNINGWKQCESKGVIEKEVYDAVVTQLK